MTSQLTSKVTADVAFVPIECEYLDKENLGWAKAYLEKQQQRLETGGDGLPAPLRSYLEAEIAAYRELITRFSAS